MQVDDILLLAYADNTIAPEQAVRVEEAMLNDPDVARRLAFLQASQLDYRRAFDHQSLPPLPKSVSDAVLAKCAGALGSPIKDDQKRQTESEPISYRSNPSIQVRKQMARRRWTTWPRLVGVFAAGAVSYGLVMHVAGTSQLFGFGPLPLTNRSAATSLDQIPARWIKEAAGYQRMFARETVADSELTPTAMKNTLNAIHDQDRLALQVPDLTGVGLTLKALQRLRYDGEPLVQIVYLPKTGAPVALCVMKEKQSRRPGDTKPTRLTVEHMEVLTWRDADLRYALIATPGSADLPTIAKDAGMTPES